MIPRHLWLSTLIMGGVLVGALLLALVVSAASGFQTGNAFKTVQQRHPHCGLVTSWVHWPTKTRATQHFQHCTITARYTITRAHPWPTVVTHIPFPVTIVPKATATVGATTAPTVAPTAKPTAKPTSTPSPTETATPKPTHTPTPSPTPLPTPPSPTATRVDPTATTVVPTAVPTAKPTATVDPSSGSPSYWLQLINAERARFGIAALSIDSVQSSGVGSCVGSQGHSDAMAASGSIWHVNASYPAASFPNNICTMTGTAGENVGEAGYASENSAVQVVHQEMMAETPNTPAGCQALPAGQINHACNILNPYYHTVGFGFTLRNNVWYLTSDFKG